jgi:tetratricopeptide (TPR) repeat protein
MCARQVYRNLLITLLLFAFLSTASYLFAATRGIQVVSKKGQAVYLYKDYYALVVGVGDYTQGWPDLPGAIKDAREVAASLQKMGFTVKLVLNPTSSQLQSTLNDMAFGMGRVKNRALLLYYAGHGETLELADSTELGYIIPTDCPLKSRDPRGFDDKAVSMRDIEDVALKVKAKHFLMMFDSCFSGSLFNLVRAAPVDISEKSARPVRQFITAGGAGEQVPDKSIFKIVFLDGITGEADLNQDGYVTGSELGMHLQHAVVNYTRGGQHPQYGKINNPRLDKGDFIFVPTIAGVVATPASPAEDNRQYAYGREDLEKETERLQADKMFLEERESKEVYPHATSTVLFDEKKIDQMASSLEGYCARNQHDIKANILLAKVYLEKCTFLKKNGHEGYKALLHRPWNTAKRIYKQAAGSRLFHSDLYYIFAKTYFIKDKTKKAIKYANIALEKSTSYSPNIDCMFLLGDCYAALAKQETSEYYHLAQKTYQEINYLNVSDDHKALAYYKLGALFSRVNQKDKADEALGSALMLAQSDSSVAIKIRSQLGGESQLVGKEKLQLASIPQNVARVSLRSDPKLVSEKHIRDLLKAHNFYDSDLNISGSFANNFVDNGDGTVTDKSTGLMWQKSGSPRAKSWNRGRVYVKHLNGDRFAGYSDWRLPTIDELASLLERKKINGVHIDPIFDKKQERCWSSDSRPDLLYGTMGLFVTWIGNFSNGRIIEAKWTDRTAAPEISVQYSILPESYVRLVRSLTR